MTDIVADEVLNLKGIPCPQNTAKAILKLTGMNQGEILKIIVDNGEPIENVKASLKEEENFEILILLPANDNTCQMFVKVLY